MSMTLDDLLRGLEKQAADQEDEKKDEDKKDDSDKKEDKSDKKEGSGKENFFEKMKAAEKDTEDSKEKEDRVKEAQLQGSALAQEIMQKVASANITTNKETDMNKSAAVAGKALAYSLLEKLASAGDVITTNGIPAGVVPNKVQVDVAQTVAEHDARIQTTPTTDAKGDNGGSINQIFDAIIADAMGAGAATPHELDHQSTSGAEGAIEGHQAPGSIQSAPVGGAEVEKAAAVSALVNSGFDFTSAVEMVKAAEEEILFEEETQIKQAAMNELVDAGVDYGLAAALVKQASLAGVARRAGAVVKDKAETAAIHGMYAADRARSAGTAAAGHLRGAGGVVASDARAFGQGARQAVAGKDAVGAPVSRLGALRRAATTGTGIAAGTAALGAGGYALAREKQAAVNGLIDAGVDFDSAVQLVNDKASELYGA